MPCRRFSAAALAIPGIICTACSVEVTDQTSSPFAYDPPINSQTFRVEVLANTTIQDVEFNAPGAGTSPMEPIGNDRFETRAPVPVCAGAIEFTVDVTYQAFFGNATETFPDAGAFTHQVTGLPPDCDDFNENFAQTFTVDSFADYGDLIPGNGLCQALLPGSVAGCTLRAAVMEANAKPGADLIRLPAGRYVLTLGGAEATDAINHSRRDLDITESVTIEGIGGANADLDDILERTTNPQSDLRDNGESSGFVRIDGNGEHRLFQVAGPGIVLRLRRVALLNGVEPGAGGAILNDGTLTLERVVMAENAAESLTGSAFGGGAVQNNGVLVAEETAFAQNGVGGLNPAGGAIHNTGEATLRRVLMAYNDARFGAALFNDAGTLTGENVTFFANRWGAAGGTPPLHVAFTGADAETVFAFTTFSAHALDDDRAVLDGSADATVSIRNGLWVANTGASCDGPVLSGGGNVLQDDCDFDPASDPLAPDRQDVGIVAGVSGLVDAGGFLPVVEIDAPFAGSSLFNALDRGRAPPFPFTDQRGSGFDRTVDGDGDGLDRADPGAYEHVP